MKIRQEYPKYNFDEAHIVTNEELSRRIAGTTEAEDGQQDDLRTKMIDQNVSDIKERAKQMRQWLWDRPEMVTIGESPSKVADEC